jgi:LmbE family N-acetylglucosaminyl deacetylase
MMRFLRPESLDEIAVLGAHCDDIEIGAGGTLLSLCRARPGLRVHAFVLAAGDPVRQAEERGALHAFCPGADLHTTLLDIPDGRLPAHWNRAKDALEAFRRTCEPDLLLTTATHDNHQDHRGLARLVPTVFRDHLVLGYEILKAEPDLAQPTLFWPLAPEVVTEKIALLHAHYPSQAGRAWFDDESFRGLLRIRGVQSGHRYAEGFHPTRIAAGAPESGH